MGPGPLVLRGRNRPYAHRLLLWLRRFTVGNPSMRRPPPINPLDPSSDLFDSCVDNWVDPQIYVIFNDDQSYPYFIIHYEEVPGTVAV